MRRFALLGLTLLLPGCSGFTHFLDDTFGVTPNHNAPLGDSQNLRRSRGEFVDVPPLTTEPGDVWPGPVKPEPTLSDVQAEQNNQPLGSSGDLRASTGPHAPASPPDLRLTPLTSSHASPSSAKPGNKGFENSNGGIAIPNGNGTSTIIGPNGSVTTVPTPN